MSIRREVWHTWRKYQRSRDSAIAHSAYWSAREAAIASIR